MVDLNPLHYVNKFNHMFGDTVADGLEFLGITDPAVNPDGIRELAKKWRALAKGLDDAAEAARKSLAEVEWEGKAAKALHKRAKSARKQATEMADSLREGAKALDDFADKAHELLSEIGVILAEIAELELAGLALSVLTGGTSAVVSTLMAGSRAAKVVALVARIEQEGTVLASAIRGVMEVIRAVERALKTLKEIRGVAAAGKMAKEGMKFSAFDTLLRDPEAFKDPEKLAGILTEGALLGVGFGALGKALGKGLKALKPSELAKLSKALKLDGSGLSRLKLRPGEWEKLPASIRAMVKRCDLDPIDVATGDMLLPHTDVQLPGTLALVLQRTHLSSYRWGGWFGLSWVSTLDQRLQADDEGIIYAAPDGARLLYPLPAPDAEDPVLPEAGQRLPLTWDAELDGALRISDPDSGYAYIFHSPCPTDDGEALDLPLQAIVDRNGQRITVHYGDDGTPAEVSHSGGYRIAIDRHPRMPRISALRLLGHEHQAANGTLLVSYGYDEDGHLTDVTNSSGVPLRFTYDDAGRITSWTDRNGTAYQYTYDESGRVVRTEGSDGYLSGTLAYDDVTRTTRVTNGLGHTTSYEHNEAYRLIRQTDPLGHVTLQEWDADHQLIAVTDPLGRTTRRVHDEHGRVVRGVRPDGRAAEADYNELGLPTAVTEPDGSVWRQEFDERGNRIAATDPAGATTRYGYNKAGHLVSVTDALGHTIRVGCDATGLPVEITDPHGAVTTYERDAFGNPVTVTDPLGHATGLEWTVEGKLARRTNPDGSGESWAYDSEGNCTSHTDPMGAVTRFEYTHFDQLAARTGPDGARYEFTHDAQLRLTGVTNPQGSTWTYVFDPAGHLISELDFDGRTLTYTHDAAGQLAARSTPAGEQIRFERDVLGRTVAKDVAGRISSYAYDEASRLIRAVNDDTVLSMRYDAAGRLLSETVNDRTTTHSYDLLGRRTGRTTPTGATTTYTFNAAGNRTRLTTVGRTLTFDHDRAGRELARHLGETVTIASVFDPLGRPTSQTVTGPVPHGVIQQRDYTYRDDSSLIAVNDHIDGPRSFDLDSAGRITAVRAEQWSETYAYDKVGNQSKAVWPTAHPGQEATGTRSYSGTRITRAGQVRYEHDQAGRISLRQKHRLSRKPDTWRYTWDAEDRLTQVVTPDGTAWRYLYDPLGRRTAKQRLAPDGHTVIDQTDFTWDGTTLAEQSSQVPGGPETVTLTWTHDGLRPVTQAERKHLDQAEIDQRFYVIVTDLVGTPTELVDEQGDIAWRARSTIWGTTAWNITAGAHTPLRFPGQYHDPETGLHYNYFRHYDPETARYLTPDPLGLCPAPNPMAYVHNPHTWADPLGLAGCQPGEGGVEVDPRKLDYLFNKNIKPDSHNSPRALQNELQLRRIGINDSAEMRRYVTEHLAGATKQSFERTFRKEWDGGSGEFGVTNSVLHGPHGALGVESTWQVLPDGTRRLSTVIFRGSGPGVSIVKTSDKWPPYNH
ncbi:RHS repeat-associated core domain-containing protein [Streptomyces tendae]|uniref:RHS repeat-associated core domain-containing protein n=1 Tax=Streptomyces tendae TaxID=1932 RepID=UPI003813939D